MHTTAARPFLPFLLCTLLVMLPGCDEAMIDMLTPATPPSISVSGGPNIAVDPRFNDLRVSMTVENNGPGTAYEIFAQVTLRKGSFIVDRTTLFFGGLREGESISDKRVFSSATSTSQYTSMEWVLYWNDADGQQHKR